MDAKQFKEQTGFISGFSTIDHIQTLEQITEKYRECNRPLYVTFIYYWNVQSGMHWSDQISTKNTLTYWNISIHKAQAELK